MFEASCQDPSDPHTCWAATSYSGGVVKLEVADGANRLVADFIVSEFINIATISPRVKSIVYGGWQVPDIWIKGTPPS